MKLRHPNTAPWVTELVGALQHELKAWIADTGQGPEGTMYMDDFAEWLWEKRSEMAVALLGILLQTFFFSRGVDFDDQHPGLPPDYLTENLS